MLIVTHESYDSVLVGTGKQNGLKSLFENCERRRRCDAERLEQFRIKMYSFRVESGKNKRAQ